MTFQLPFSSQKATTEAKKFTHAITDTGVAIVKTDNKTEQLNQEFSKLGRRSVMTAKQTGHLETSLLSLGKVATIAGVAVAGFATFKTVKLIEDSLKVFGNYQTALVGVGKTTGFAGEELKTFGEDIERLSLDKLPIATNSLLDIAGAAAQLGVSGKANLLKFTETMARLEKSTDIVGEEGAKQIARLLGLTGEGVGQIDRFGAAIVGLGNQTKALEGEILSMGSELGRSLSVFRIGSADLLGMSAAFKELGLRNESTASVIGRTFRKIDEAVRSGGEQLETFAKISGLTGEEFKKAFATSKVGGFNKFITGLGRVDNMAASLKKLGLTGDEINKVLPLLATNSVLVTEKMKLSNEEFIKNTALINESNTAFDTYANKLILLDNNLDNLKRVMGEEFAPVAIEIIESFIEFIQENRESIKGFATDVATAIKSISDFFKWLNKLDTEARARDKAVEGWFSDLFDTITDFAGSLTGANFEPINRGLDDTADKAKKTDDALSKLNRTIKSSAAPKISLHSAEAGADQGIDWTWGRGKQTTIGEFEDIEASVGKNYKDPMIKANTAIMDDFNAKMATAAANFGVALARGSKTATQDFLGAVGGAGGAAAGTVYGGPAGAAAGTVYGGPAGGAAGGIIGGYLGDKIGQAFTHEISESTIKARELADSFADLKRSQDDFNQSWNLGLMTTQEQMEKFAESTIDIESTQAERDALQAVLSEQRELSRKQRESKKRRDPGEALSGEEQRRLTELNRIIQSSATINELNSEINELIKVSEDYRQAVLNNISANLQQVEAIKQQGFDFVESLEKAKFTTEDWQSQLETSRSAIPGLTSEADALREKLSGLDENSSEYAETLSKLNEVSTDLSQAQKDQFESVKKMIEDADSLATKFIDFQKQTIDPYKGLTKAELESAFRGNLGAFDQGLSTSELEALFDDSTHILSLIEQETRAQTNELKNVIKSLEDTQRNIFNKITELTVGRLSLDQTFEAKQTWFESLIETARGTGLATDIQAVTDYASTFLEAGRDRFKSGADYQTIFNDVINRILPEMADLTQAGITQAEDQTEVLGDKMLDLRTELSENLTPAIGDLKDSIDDLIDVLRNPTRGNQPVSGSTGIPDRPNVTNWEPPPLIPA